MEKIDRYSFQCGIVDSINEMVATGIKAMALSRPLDSPDDADELEKFVIENCHKYGTKYYRESQMLVTDLFPTDWCENKIVFLLYREDHVLDQYLRLKEHKEALLAERAYFGGNRTQLAVEVGRLLSYDADTIHGLIARNKPTGSSNL